MLAVILAGGFATRLRPLTLTRPKPLLPVLDKPLVLWIIESLKRAGVDRIVLSVRYMADAIESTVHREVNDIEVISVREPRPLGDAGPLRLIAERVGLDETFLVVYGDVFSDVDIARVVEYHRSAGGLATMTLVEVDDPTRYGIAELGEDGRIVRFVEKPRREEVFSNLANAGIYVFEPEIVKLIPSGFAKIARDLVPQLVERGQVYGYVHSGMWIDIGVPRDYLRANIEALRRFYPRGFVHPEARVSERAEIVEPCYIGPGTSIGGGSVVGPDTVLGRGVSVGEGCRVSRSLVFSNTTIESYSFIDEAIIGEGCYIGRWCRVERGAVIGDEVVLNDGVYVDRNVFILPYKEIDASVRGEGRIVL